MKHCKHLDGSQVAITPGYLKACGSATHGKGTPIICEYTEPDIQPSLFRQGLERVRLENQSASGPCVGCRYLIEQPAPRWANFISTMSLHDFSGCNSHCVYCVGSEYDMPVKYKVSQSHTTLFTNLLQSKMIRPGLTAVGWGGGEPTLLDTFEDTVDLLRVNRVRQIINTNGIVLSKAIIRALTLRQATVRISVDSGTDETYTRVKRNPHVKDVWESVTRYAHTGGDFILKYIILRANSEPEELRAFVYRAQGAGAKRVCISADAHGEYPHLNGHTTPKELIAAASLYNLCKQCGISAYFEPIWTAQHIREIKGIGNFLLLPRLPVDLWRQIALRLVK